MELASPIRPMQSLENYVGDDYQDDLQEEMAEEESLTSDEEVEEVSSKDPPAVQIFTIKDDDDEEDTALLPPKPSPPSKGAECDEAPDLADQPPYSQVMELQDSQWDPTSGPPGSPGMPEEEVVEVFDSVQEEMHSNDERTAVDDGNKGVFKAGNPLHDVFVYPNLASN